MKLLTSDNSYSTEPQVLALIMERIRAKKDYVSNSYLSSIKSAMHDGRQLTGKERFLLFGNELHKRVLEPKRKKIKLFPEEEEMMKAMVDAAKSHSVISKKLKSHHHEIEFDRAIVKGLPEVKVILDLFTIEDGDDLKTTVTASPDAFLKASYNYDYFRQGWLYMKTCNLKTFTFWGIEKKKNNPKIFELPVMDYKHHLEEGKEQAILLMETHSTFKKLLHKHGIK
jgi:hypothetical protein